MGRNEGDAPLQGEGRDDQPRVGGEGRSGESPGRVQADRPFASAGKPAVEVMAASFAEAQKTEAPKSGLDLDFILDIPLSLTVELGRSRMLISDLLKLGPGAVVELMKLAGEPMDVYVNQRLIARGEAVVVNEKFGVRLTDIVSPAERIHKLK